MHEDTIAVVTDVGERAELDPDTKTWADWDRWKWTNHATREQDHVPLRGRGGDETFYVVRPAELAGKRLRRAR